MNPKLKELMSAVCDQELFEECCMRMLKKFRDRTGYDFTFGEFSWVVHQGKLAKVEECPRGRVFIIGDQGKGS